MSRFSVGDKVRVSCPGSPHHGVETQVISPQLVGSLGFVDGSWHVVPHYRVNLRSTEDAKWVGFEPHELIPLYDGRELVSWESCAWKPTGVDA